MFRTHLAFGFLIALLWISIFNTKYPFLFIILVTIFSSIPDIDHRKSKIGRKLPFLSWPISFIFKHRGFLHSIFPPIILFLILTYFNLNFLAITIALGYIAHLLGDALTREGINFLHPFSLFRIQGPLKTGTLFETLFFFGIVIFDIIYTAKLLNII